MKFSQFLSVSFLVAAILILPCKPAVAADSYNAAFQTCQSAIAERFGEGESVAVKRKSFGKHGRGYKVVYVVQQSDSDAAESDRHIVKCKTNAKGDLKSLDVS